MGKSKLIACIILLMLFTVLGAGFYCLRTYWIVAPVAAGQKFLPFKLQTLDGADTDDTFLLRRPSLISFISVSCMHCTSQMQELLALYPLIKDSIGILAVSLSGRGETAEWMSANKIAIPVYLDLYKEARERFRVRLLPALFCVDTQRQILNVHIGEEKKERVYVQLKDFMKSIRCAGGEKR